MEDVRREPVRAHDDAELALGRREDLEAALRDPRSATPFTVKRVTGGPFVRDHLAAQLARGQRDVERGAPGLRRSASATSVEIMGTSAFSG